MQQGCLFDNLPCNWHRNCIDLFEGLKFVFILFDVFKLLFFAKCSVLMLRVLPQFKVKLFSHHLADAWNGAQI